MCRSNKNGSNFTWQNYWASKTRSQYPLEFTRKLNLTIVTGFRLSYLGFFSAASGIQIDMVRHDEQQFTKFRLNAVLVNFYHYLILFISYIINSFWGASITLLALTVAKLTLIDYVIE